MSPGQSRQVRAELIQAAIDLVRVEGAIAVTTTALAKRVGISQSGFYQYFTNVDDCLGAAAVTFAEEMRLTLRAIRERFFAQVELRDGADTQERLRRAFEQTLGYAVSEPRLVELINMFRRFRGDASSPFGDALARVYAQVVDDMVAEVYRAGESIGLSETDRPATRIYIRISLSMWSAGLELLLSNADLNREQIIDQLARSQYGMLHANLTAPAQRRRRMRLIQR